MPRLWNPYTRSEDIKVSRSKEFDLVIIGGGITGAGIARECTLRGLSFCLLDKKDFAFGTSSRSSKLFHGGMRYLTRGEFSLVRESTSERNWLRKHIPNLVRPLGFVYPSYENYRARPYMVCIGVKLYDIISDWFNKFKNYRKSKIFKADYIKEIEPEIATEDPDLGKMILAGLYYDTNCDDARVTLETIKESLDYSAGQSVALNYARVDGYVYDSSNKVRGVLVKDIFSENTFTIKAKCVVSAAGIWTDEVLSFAKYDQSRIYPTKGVHVVVPNERIGNRNAVTLSSIDDGRFFFVLRRSNVSFIGTTDTAYFPESRNLDEPWCNKEDCDYLLRTVNKIFPGAMLSYNDVISTFAGIRPLIRKEGSAHESDVSRKHEIFKTQDGIVAIAGGKSTTHRLMAEDLIFYLVNNNYLDHFEKKEFNKRGYSKKPFKVGLSRKEFEKTVEELGLNESAHPSLIEYLHQQFGKGGIEILKEINQYPEKGKQLLEGYPHCEAEISYLLKYESAPRLMDILCRRTEAQWMIWHYKQPQLAEAVAEIMSCYYGWSKKRKAAEISEYLCYIDKTISFIKEAGQDERSKPIQ